MGNAPKIFKKEGLTEWVTPTIMVNIRWVTPTDTNHYFLVQGLGV